jgi:hypothetical protein
MRHGIPAVANRSVHLKNIANVYVEVHEHQNDFTDLCKLHKVFFAEPSQNHFSFWLTSLQSNTAEVSRPTFNIRTGASVTTFITMSAVEVVSGFCRSAVARHKFSCRSTSSAGSDVDWIAEEITPILTALFSCSMLLDTPSSFKEAFITPVTKKPGISTMDDRSYCPISNLSVISTLLEWIVAMQLID